MFAVQPWRGRQCDKELASIGVGATIGHTEDASTGVFERWGYLVLELFAVYGFPASSGSRGIATLNHEVGYNSVKYKVVEVVALSKGFEIVAGFWRVVVVELDDDRALRRLGQVSLRRNMRAYNCGFKGDIGSHCAWTSVL